MINVLYISHEGKDIGGSTKSLMNMISSLKGKINPIVISPSEGRATEYVLGFGIEHHIVPFNLSFTDKLGLQRLLTFAPRLIRDYFVNLKAKKVIKQIIGGRNIAIVHSNSASIDIGHDLAQAIGARHVWHLREFLDIDFGFRPIIGWNLFRRRIRNTDQVICISKSVQTHFRLRDADNVRVIYNAVVKGTETPKIATKENYLLFTGKISPAKGIEDALEAFKTLSERHTFKLIIAGQIDPSYRATLSKGIEKYLLSSQIEFIGFSDNVDSLMSKALCFLMCSKNEALGRVTIEAMYNGCPVIGYDNAGTSEIIEHGVNGFLYRGTDALVSQIEYVVSNDMLPLILKSQQFALDNFSESRFSEKIWDIYRQLSN